MEKKEVVSGSLSIYIQAVIAMLFINLIHKIVREIPGGYSLSADRGPIGIIGTIVMAIIIAVSIVLLCLKRKEGLYFGIIPAIWAMLQWILVHVIWAYPDQNGVWWYPIFPIVQGLLIIYFSYLAWKNEESFK